MDKPTEKKTAAKKTAAKKTAAKKTSAKKTAAPAPAPVETPPAPRDVLDIAAIPPVPALRSALTAWARGDGRQSEQDTAMLARELSHKHCHFCGSESHPSMLGARWDNVTICECLSAAVVTEPTDDKTPARREEGREKPVSYGQLRVRPSAYQEFFPGWKKRVPELVKLAREHRVGLDEAVYANRCACGSDFAVTVGMIVNNVRRYGAHREMHFCRECRQKFHEGQDGDRAPTPEGMARPGNKRDARVRADSTLAVADVGGNATLADVFAPALSRSEAS